MCRPRFPGSRMTPTNTRCRMNASVMPNDGRLVDLVLIRQQYEMKTVRVLVLERAIQTGTHRRQHAVVRGRRADAHLRLHVDATSSAINQVHNQAVFRDAARNQRERRAALHHRMEVVLRKREHGGGARHRHAGFVPRVVLRPELQPARTLARHIDAAEHESPAVDAHILLVVV